MFTRINIALAAAACLALTTTGSRAHEGHTHGDEKPAQLAVSSAAPRAETSSAAFEIVAAAEQGLIRLYIDRFDTNEPVEGALVTADTAQGSDEAAAEDAGTYVLKTAWSSKPGAHDVMLTVAAGDKIDILPLTINIPEPNVGTPSASTVVGGWTPPNLPISKEIAIAAVAGFFLGVSVLLFRRRAAAGAILLASLLAGGFDAALAHEGHAHGDEKPAAAALPTRDVAQRLPDGTLFVPKPTQRILAIRTVIAKPEAHRRTIELPGRVIADPNASGYAQVAVGGRLSPPPGGFPRLGSKVKKGDVLAYVTPPVGSKDASDMRQTLGELDQQISIFERRVARFEPLAQSGAVTRTQLDEARLELEGLRERRRTLQEDRREPEALVAPVDGIVADANAVSGQMAEPANIVFHIVDPKKLWVEALSFDPVSETQSAAALTGDGRSVELRYQGAGLADKNQSVPVHFEVAGEAAAFRIGQFVTVLASTDTTTEGVALPRTSVVRAANGQDLVYEHTTAERFEAREVRVEPLDGERVLIAAGIEPSKRIVTQGSELLNQVR